MSADDLRHAWRRLRAQPGTAAVAAAMLALAIGVTSAMFTVVDHMLLRAWPLSRALASLAFGVTIASPLVWGVVFTTIGAATILAAWRPAVDAMRADPVLLLRAE